MEAAAAAKTSSTGGDSVVITTTIESTAGQGLEAAKDVAFGSVNIPAPPVLLLTMRN
jgi:hypothetical protein